MAGLAAGDLDRRIRLQRFGTAEDGYGDPKEGFSTLAEVWASIRPGPGAERLATAENAASAPTVFRIRYSSTVADLNAKDRIEYPIGSGRTFDIKSVFEIGRRDGMEIAAIGSGD